MKSNEDILEEKGLSAGWGTKNQFGEPRDLRPLTQREINQFFRDVRKGKIKVIF